MIESIRDILIVATFALGYTIASGLCAVLVYAWGRNNKAPMPKIMPEKKPELSKAVKLHEVKP